MAETRDVLSVTGMKHKIEANQPSSSRSALERSRSKQTLPKGEILKIHQNLSWANKSTNLLVPRRNSDRDVAETQMDYTFMNRKRDIDLMCVLNFLACESGCTFVCDGVEGPG